MSLSLGGSHPSNQVPHALYRLERRRRGVTCIAPGLSYHSPVMRFGWVVLVIVALDFATPMPPGAVQLADGSLEIDAGLCGRRGQDLTPAVAPHPYYHSTVVSARPTPQARRVDRTPPPASRIFRTALELHSACASSLDDD
jgi:hypothetical protein